MKFKDYFIDKIFSVICFIITEILIVGLLWLIEVRTIFIIFSVSIIFVFLHLHFYGILDGGVNTITSF